MNVPTAQPRMTRPEHRLLLAATQGAQPRLMLRTATRIDTGRWWRSSRVWLCVTDSEIILLAAARRQYAQRLSLADARESWYCHTSGQLVLESSRPVRFNRLSLCPLDALRVLSCIEASTDPAADPQATATENSRA